ncbi:MAG: hypothetical protein SX243_19605 [Acidobacteriota bacterium]|nr:hypothetical protein [Acidobacteriota bacterium]
MGNVYRCANCGSEYNIMHPICPTCQAEGMSQLVQKPAKGSKSRKKGKSSGKAGGKKSGGGWVIALLVVGVVVFLSNGEKKTPQGTSSGVSSPGAASQSATSPGATSAGSAPSGNASPNPSAASPPKSYGQPAPPYRSQGTPMPQANTAETRKRLRVTNNCSLEAWVTISAWRKNDWPEELKEDRELKPGQSLEASQPADAEGFFWSGRSSHYRRLGAATLQFLEFRADGVGEWTGGDLDGHVSKEGDISLTCPGAMDSDVPFRYPIL